MLSMAHPPSLKVKVSNVSVASHWRTVCERDGITLLCASYGAENVREILDEFYTRCGGRRSMLVVDPGPSAQAEGREAVAIAVHLAPGKPSQVVLVDSSEESGCVREVVWPHGTRVVTVSDFEQVALRCVLSPPNGTVLGLLLVDNGMAHRVKIMKNALAARGSFLAEDRLTMDMNMDDAQL